MPKNIVETIVAALVQVWWRRKQLEHRRVAVWFFALAAALTAVLLTVVWQRSLLTVREDQARRGLSAVLQPDFAALVPEAAGGEVTSLEVPGPRAAHVVGYRGERGAELALVRWEDNAAAYRVTAKVPLRYGAHGALPALHAVELADRPFVAVQLDFGNGWDAVYLLEPRGDRLVAWPFAPLGGYALVGADGGGCRSLRLGDVDGDGTRAEVLYLGDRADGAVDVYGWRVAADRLIEDAALVGPVRQLMGMFPETRERCAETSGLSLDYLGPDGVAVTEFISAHEAGPVTEDLPPLVPEIEQE